MAECCPDCGRPHARDGCPNCGRSKSAGWSLNHEGFGLGKGGTGGSRARRAGRRYRIGVQFTEDEAAALKRLAAERGHAVARTIRELIEDGWRYRRNGQSLAPRPFVDGAGDDADDADAPDWGPVFDGPCDCHAHSPVVASDSRICHDEAEHVCALHGGSGLRCPRCKRNSHNASSAPA